MSKRNRPRNQKKLVKDIEKSDAPKVRKSMSYSLSKVKKTERQIQLRTFPICWGFPMDEVMYAKFFENAMTNLNIMPWDTILTSLSTYLPDARNVIHTNFLGTDAKYLFMIDSDVLAPPGTVARLMEHQKPLVGGWYKHKIPDEGMHNPVVYDYAETHEDDKGWDVNWYRKRKYPSEGLERVDALGAGCLLMKRDLAEALGERPYDMNAGGEDMVLCKKVYDLGFDIHVDWSLACAHIGVSYV